MLAPLLLAAAAPTCEGAEACTVAWGRALRWVMARNATIAQQSESLIVTGEPLGATHKYQVTRIPDGAGRYTLELRIACAPLRGCPRERERADFAAAVRGD